MKKTIAFAALALWLAALPSAVPAAEFEGDDEVNLDRPVNDDAYVSGRQVTISAPVEGDLFIAGGNLTLRDSIGGDLTIVGGNIVLDGTVADDVRAAGGHIEVKGHVGDDVIIFGGEIFIEEEAVIGGDLVVFGGSVTVEGIVNGSVQLESGEAHLEGTVNGPLSVEAGELTLNGIVKGPARLTAGEMKIGSSAQFASEVRYWTAEGEVDFGDSKTVFDESLQPVEKASAFAFMGLGYMLFNFWVLLSGSIVIVLLILVFPKRWAKAGRALQAHFGPSLGFGALYFFIGPAVILTLFITVIGIPLGMAGLALYGVSMLFGRMLAAIILTYWSDQQSGKGWSPGVMTAIALLLYFGFQVIDLIPVAGWLISALIVLATFGGFLWSLNQDRKARQPQTVPSETAGA